MKLPEQSPLPWRRNPDEPCKLYDAHGKGIGNAEAAAFVVVAANYHERLCATLAALVEANETDYSRPDGTVDLSLAAKAAQLQQQAHDLLAEIGHAEAAQ